MSDLGLPGGQVGRDEIDQRSHDTVEIEFPLGGDPEGGIQPPQLRLALGINVVVDVEDLILRSIVAIQQFNQFLEALAGLRGDRQHRCFGVLAGEQFEDMEEALDWFRDLTLGSGK